jgi:hypothetical protein
MLDPHALKIFIDGSALKTPGTPKLRTTGWSFAPAPKRKSARGGYRSLGQLNQQSDTAESID